MSQTYCANCGKQISQTARFCRFCGTPARRSESTTPRPSRTREFSPSPEPARAPTPTVIDAVEKIPQEIIDALYARKRKVEIKNELTQLLDEVEELGKKVEIGLITEEESNQLSKDLQDKIIIIKEEQKSLQPKPLDLELLTKDEKKWKQRLEKIEEKKRAQAVSEEVFTSLRDEYSSELASVQQKKAIEERKARRWLVDLQRDTRELNIQVERLKVRADVERLNSEKLAQETKDLTLEMKKKGTAAEILSEILSTI